MSAQASPLESELAESSPGPRSPSQAVMPAVDLETARFLLHVAPNLLSLPRYSQDACWNTLPQPMSPFTSLALS